MYISFKYMKLIRKEWVQIAVLNTFLLRSTQFPLFN